MAAPLGLAMQPPPSRPRAIHAELADSSPDKGPLLVVEDGDTEVLTLRVYYQDTGDAAGSVTVGSAVVDGGILDLDFHIGAATAAVWANYLILIEPDIQIIPLWSVSLSPIHPPIEMPVSFPLPGMGWVGIWSGLFTEDGPQVADLRWVDTGW